MCRFILLVIGVSQGDADVTRFQLAAGKTVPEKVLCKMFDTALYKMQYKDVLYYFCTFSLKAQPREYKILPFLLQTSPIPFVFNISNFFNIALGKDPL